MARRFGRNYGRDPFRVHLTAVAPYSTDARQPELDLSMRPIASSSPFRVPDRSRPAKES